MVQSEGHHIGKEVSQSDAPRHLGIIEYFEYY